MTTNEIVTSLDRVLKPLGFVRRKGTWNRTVEMFVDVLDIQISKNGDTATLNAGVLEKSVYTECWGKELDEFVEEPFCTVRARIGELIDGKDKWWPVGHNETDGDMAAHISKFFLPFFEKLHSLERMREWLIRTNVVAQKYPPPVICLAVIEHRLKNEDEACAILSKLSTKVPGSWKVRVGEVTERLGCS
jgi:hypothetical protein